MKRLGRKGEDLAAKYLKKKGFEIISRNYRAPSGEVDIIARDGDTVVFVEVKTRADDSFANPYESVGEKKKARIRYAALHYLSRMKEDVPSRFDVLSITLAGGHQTIEHIEDAFEISS